VRFLITQEQGTGQPQVNIHPISAAPQASKTTDNNLHAGAYAAITVSIIVLGIIVVTVIVYLIMRERYSLKNQQKRRQVRPNAGMTSETASGIGNPVYKMFGVPDGGQGDIDDVDIPDMFAPSGDTLTKPVHEGTLGKDSKGNPLYSDPYAKLGDK
jgi:hypothetical protein